MSTGSRFRKLNRSSSYDRKKYERKLRDLWSSHIHYTGRSVWSKDILFSPLHAACLNEVFTHPLYTSIHQIDEMPREFSPEYYQAIAKIMLIGEFEWEGLVVAKSKPLGFEDRVGWLVNTKPNYMIKPDAFGIAYKRKFPNGEDLVFRPFVGCKAHIKPLIEVLYDKRDGTKPVPKDRNVFNLVPSNITYMNKSGRPIYCSQCGLQRPKHEMIDDDSNGFKQWYCSHCLQP